MIYPWFLRTWLGLVKKVFFVKALIWLGRQSPKLGSSLTKKEPWRGYGMPKLD